MVVDPGSVSSCVASRLEKSYTLDIMASSASSRIRRQSSTSTRQRMYYCRKNDASNREKLILNVGGKIYPFTEKHLARAPESRLSQLNEARVKQMNMPLGILDCCDDIYYENDDQIYYFDRDYEIFEFLSVIFYKGVPVHVPYWCCKVRLEDELKFWRLSEKYLDSCCAARLKSTKETLKRKDEIINAKIRLIKSSQEKPVYTKVNSWRDLYEHFIERRSRLWDLLENDCSSSIGKVWTLLSVFFIMLSLISFVIGTLPMDIDETDIEHRYSMTGNNTTEGGGEQKMLDSHIVLINIERICMVWFTFEYVLRLLLAPQVLVFIRKFMNVIDLLLIIPFYIELLSNHEDEALSAWKGIVQAFRVMRIFRIFRLGKHSKGLQLLYETVNNSWNELSLLLTFVLTAVLLLSNILYVTEGTVVFDTIGDAYWFSCVTITTVGYGRYVPYTPHGKIITCSCYFIGILSIALPIHPIISRFTKYYNNMSELDRCTKFALEIQEREKSVETSIFGRSGAPNKWITGEDGPSGSRGKAAGSSKRKKPQKMTTLSLALGASAQVVLPTTMKSSNDSNFAHLTQQFFSNHLKEQKSGIDHTVDVIVQPSPYDDSPF